jgi:hypothetical protein
MTDYPEHDKITALGGANQHIGAFIEWLNDNRYTICEWQNAGDEGRGYFPVSRSINSWLYQYFQIDPVKIEQEKRSMLDELRAANEVAP